MPHRPATPEPLPGGWPCGGRGGGGRLEPLLVFVEDGEESAAVDGAFQVLGTDQGGEADAGQAAGPGGGEAERPERLDEVGFPGGVDAVHDLGGRFIAAAPGPDGTFGLVVGGDGQL